MRTRWLSRRAIALHVTVVVVVGGCLALGWWQLTRAFDGNSLSWVYTFEWPFFAAYGIYMWWKLLHEPIGVPRELSTGSPGAPGAPEAGTERAMSLPDRVDALDFDPYDEEADPELAAYNRYLASLHNSDRARSSRAGSARNAS